MVQYEWASGGINRWYTRRAAAYDDSLPMSLWIHRFQPRSLQELSYNRELTSNLEQLAKGEDFPHLLLYGPPGAGKQTRVAALLQELFGPGTRRIKIEARVLDLGGSRKLELNMVSSVYHVEITPAEAGNQDRFVIQDLLKEIAQTQQVDQNARHRYKVVVINDADQLSRDAQAALRRTMEIYTANLRVVMIATSLSPIMGPIRSRTLLVRVPAPTVADITGILAQVAADAHVPVDRPDELYATIAHKSQRNLRRALLMLEAMYAQNERVSASQAVPLSDWESVIDAEAAEIVKTRSVQKLAEVRATNYELLAHCIPPQIVLKTLLFAILARVGAATAPRIIDAAAKFDHRLRLGNKHIFHIEGFIASVMNILETR